MKPEIIKKLEGLISNNIRVFVICIADIEILYCIKMEIIRRNLENVVVWHYMNDESDNYIDNCLTPNEMNDVVDINNLYNFTDKLIILSESGQYGNLMNYVRTGILTKKEMVDALLYKI